MRRTYPFCFLLLLLSAPACLAQGILPASVAKWKATSAPIQISAANIRQIAGEASAALHEYGVESAETCAYIRGAATLTATAYTFASPSGAYGAYSFLRTPDMPQAKLAQHSSVSNNRALALTGNLVIQFTGSNLRQDYDMMDLLVAEAGAHAHFGIYPPLAQRLPTKDFIPRSDHYILGPVALGKFFPLAGGDWLGFSKGAEAEQARYKLDGHDASLLITDYPTPQIAQTRMQELKAEFGTVDLNGSNQKPSPGATKTAGVFPLYARRDGTMIALLSGAPSEPAANSLLEKFHAGLAVMWNVPVLKKNQPSMATIVVGTIIGAGEICAFTLLGGVVFAGLRLLIKRMWPGRVFDRATSFEILELGLSSRPVRTNDLYQVRNP